MKVRLDFSSPVVLGGRKTVSNYIESIDYIQGNVMRAALSRYILNRCTEFGRDEIIEINGQLKKNWVYFRDKEGCKNCKLVGLCKKFSSLKFSYFYPKDAIVLPLTSMVCKLDESHGYIDLLLHKKECPECGKDGRVESATGYIKNNKKYNVKKMFLTMTEINRYTKTARDGRLYSIVSVSETSENENSYTGYIYGLTEDDLKNIDELRVGKYVSIGYGKCTLSQINEFEIKKEELLKELLNFNNKYKNLNINNADDDFNYFAIKFISDAKLNIDADLTRCMTTEEYITLWQDILKIDKRFEISKMYCETFNFRGFDLSRADSDIREKPSLMLEKGSVILFKTKKEFENILEYFLNLKGIGEENENGFGDFIFYFGGVTQ